MSVYNHLIKSLESQKQVKEVIEEKGWSSTITVVHAKMNQLRIKITRSKEGSIAFLVFGATGFEICESIRELLEYIS